MPLYAVFIDFSEAFDTVFGKCWCTTEFINLARALHNVMLTMLTRGSVKLHLQGICCHRFSQARLRAFSDIFLSLPNSNAKVAFDGVGDGIFIQTRTNADLFNVPLFRAKTHTA